uniref:Uncharacterized protein n=1 Tax=Anguilla anguilla TaxID=7936 RepID=A0A0E9TIY3_ANGAN
MHLSSHSSQAPSFRVPQCHLLEAGLHYAQLITQYITCFCCHFRSFDVTAGILTAKPYLRC